MMMNIFRPLIAVFFIYALYSSVTYTSVAYAEEATYSLMSASELPPIEHKSARKYLSGQKTTWPDGTPVVLVILPSGSPEMAWMCKFLIKMPEATYRRFIMEKSLRGGLKIVEVDNAEEAVRALKEHAGAVAPIPSEGVSSNLYAVTVN